MPEFKNKACTRGYTQLKDSLCSSLGLKNERKRRAVVSILKMSVNLDKRLEYDRDKHDEKRPGHLKGLRQKCFNLGKVPLMSHIL